MNGLEKILIGIFSLTLLGCAAPPQVAKEAAGYLRGNCLNLFLDARYQYVARVNGLAAFALAEQDGAQICGASNNHEIQDGLLINLPPIDRLEALAIQKCEAAKPSGFEAPCKLFARGQRIVWKKSISGGLK